MSRRTLGWLVVILLAAAFLRFDQLTISPPGLFPDEAMDGNNALEALHTGHFKVFYPPNNGEEGLFANIEAAVLAVSGAREPWTLRLPSAVFGLLTVLGLFLLARELLGRDDVALLAAFFLATSFWHVNFSRIGFRAIMAPCFMVWALWLLLRSNRATRMGPGAWQAAAAGALFGLGFYSYIAYRVTPFLLLLIVPFFWREKRLWRTAAIFSATAIVVALPLALYFIANPGDFSGRSSQLSVFSSMTPVADILSNVVKTIGMLDVHGDNNWRHNIAGRPELYWPVGIAFWVGSILGLVALIRKKLPAEDTKRLGRERFVYVFCIGWIVLAALPAILSDEGAPHALRSILMIPPIMLVAASGGIWIRDEAVRRMPAYRRVVNPIAAIVLVMIALAEGHAYLGVWAKSPNTADAFAADLAALGYTIRNLPESTPKYVVIEPNGGTVAQVDPWDPAGRIQEIPIVVQTVMFLTDSYRPEEQLAKNIHYVMVQDTANVPHDGPAFLISRK